MILHIFITYGYTWRSIKEYTFSYVIKTKLICFTIVKFNLLLYCEKYIAFYTSTIYTAIKQIFYASFIMKM